MPLANDIPGFLFEFKYTKDARENLESLADKALQQIDDKKYDTELRNAGVKSIIKIGIAFRGKNAVVKQGWKVSEGFPYVFVILLLLYKYKNKQIVSEKENAKCTDLKTYQ